MRSAEDWFREYGESHRHRANKLLHWVCVSAIVLSVIGYAIEGRRPSFFKDPRFLLIGPRWPLGFVYRRLGIAY